MENKKDQSGKIVLMAAVSILIGLYFAVMVTPIRALSLDELLVKVERQYDLTQDFEAGFIQETTLKSLAKTEREQGRLYFKRPGKMLWQYEKPQRKTLVVNPEKSWLYLPEDRVAYVQQTDRLLQSTAAVRLLSGFVGIKNDFHVQFAEADQGERKGNYFLRLIPREGNAGFSQAHIEISGATYFINRIWFEDPYGNVTRVTLFNTKLNQKLKDDKFLFRIPVGVEIYSLP
ncbi:MAG: outer membrane lipoprotein carrier protein LolA [Deltaproteobacteria bacterium]|nr:outer membrane lipoprotein carrier protein LolA [Deltaproteobacteria bacterium]